MRAVSVRLLLGAIAVIFGLLVHRQARAFAAACATRGVKARALMPLPDAPRAALAGICIAAAVGLEGTGRATLGACAAAAAALAAALRAPRGRGVARGPGRWLLLSAEDAFRSRGGGGPARWLFALGGLAALGAAALVARRFDVDGPWLVALDAVAFVPVLVTGRASQLPPDGAASAAPWLAAACSKLQTVASLRVRPWARVPLGESVVRVAQRPGRLAPLSRRTSFASSCCLARRCRASWASSSGSAGATRRSAGRRPRRSSRGCSTGAPRPRAWRVSSPPRPGCPGGGPRSASCASGRGCRRGARRSRS